MYEVIIAANMAVLQAKSPEALCRLVCHAMVDHIQFQLCAIMSQSPNVSSLTIDALVGGEVGDMRAISSMVENLIGHGKEAKEGIAFRAGTPYINNDIVSDDCTTEWKEEAISFGVAAAAILPLVSGKNLVGTLLLYSPAKNTFSNEVVNFLRHISNIVGFALEKFENEVDRTCAEDLLRANEEKYRTILETLEEAYYEIDLQGREILNNGAFFRILGYTDDNIKQFDYRRHQTPAMQEAFQNVYLTGESKQSTCWECLHKNGSTLHVEGSINLIRNVDGDAIGFKGIFRDVTARLKIEEALRTSEARFRALTHLSSDWYWEQDAELKFMHLESRQGKDDPMQKYLVGKRLWESEFEIEECEGQDKHRDVVAARLPFRDVVAYRTAPDGVAFYVSMSGEPMFDSSGLFLGYRGVTREITEQKRAEERIRYLATHDELTGLPNRSKFSQLLKHSIPAASRHQRNMAVLFIDLDRFKFVNDTLGHDAGDKLLKVVTTRFKNALRAEDVIARLGGDEFVVLIQDLNTAAKASKVAKKILAAAMQPISLMGQECQVTASVGISLFPNDGTDEHSLMKSADIAMYFAKGKGKNNFQFFSRDINAHSLERMDLESKLRLALERQEFSVHYQPKVDLASGRVNGAEALLRWRNPELGLMSPADFISVAEETGLIVPIGKWVLETACAQNIAWQRRGLPPIGIAVNLSALQFTHEHLLTDIAAALESTGMAPHLLELEITESMVIQHPAQTIELLKAIKSTGVRLAIDDFGTGSSSLWQLKILPIDTLKVDQSFIRDLAINHGDKEIIKAIIALGKALNMTVVAEGVETIEQASFLRKNDCDEIQGYYFSRPLDGDRFFELTSNDNMVLKGGATDAHVLGTLLSPQRSASCEVAL